MCPFWDLYYPNIGFFGRLFLFYGFDAILENKNEKKKEQWSLVIEKLNKNKNNENNFIIFKAHKTTLTSF